MSFPESCADGFVKYFLSVSKAISMNRTGAAKLPNQARELSEIMLKNLPHDTMHPYLVRHLVEDLVRHDGGDGAADLVVPRQVHVVRAGGPEQDVEEPRGDGHLGEVAEGAGLAQADKCGERPLQAVELAHLNF